MTPSRLTQPKTMDLKHDQNQDTNNCTVIVARHGLATKNQHLETMLHTVLTEGILQLSLLHQVAFDGRVCEARQQTRDRQTWLFPFFDVLELLHVPNVVYHPFHVVRTRTS